MYQLPLIRWETHLICRTREGKNPFVAPLFVFLSVLTTLQQQIRGQDFLLSETDINWGIIADEPITREENKFTSSSCINGFRS